MIHLHLNLTSPFSDDFLNVHEGNWKVSKNKAVETAVYLTNVLFLINFNLTFNQDHAGLRLNLGLLGYEFHFMFYDTRHWDSEKRAWVVYE